MGGDIASTIVEPQAPGLDSARTQILGPASILKVSVPHSARKKNGFKPNKENYESQSHS